MSVFGDSDCLAADFSAFLPILHYISLHIFLCYKFYDIFWCSSIIKLDNWYIFVWCVDWGHNGLFSLFFLLLSSNFRLQSWIVRGEWPQKIQVQRRKVLAALTHVDNDEHRHRVKIQMHTQNKEQMLRISSQVTFVKKIYIKYYFIWKNVVEWVYR